MDPENYSEFEMVTMETKVKNLQAEIARLQKRAEIATAHLNSTMKYITDDIQAAGHVSDAIAALQGIELL